MNLDADILSIQVSELLKGKTDDFYRIDFVSTDYRETYTITACPAHKNFARWLPLIETGHELVVQVRGVRTLFKDLDESRCKRSGAVRLNADSKPTFINSYDRNQALDKLKETLGLNRANPIADPLQTLFGYGDEDEQ